MSHSKHVKHLFESVKEEIDRQDPLGERRSPFLAAIIGFLFGPVGMAIYFQSGKDFLICFIALILLFILIPGLGIVPGWLFSAVYGFYRAHTSNEKLK